MSQKAIKEIPLIGQITPKPRSLDRLAKRILFSRLTGLQYGSITIREGETEMRFGQSHPTSDLTEIHVTLDIKNTQFYGEVVVGGSIGAGEAYMQG